MIKKVGHAHCWSESGYKDGRNLSAMDLLVWPAGAKTSDPSGKMTGKVNGGHGLTGSHTVKVISLGCAKNRVDSEVMLGLLREAGYRIVGSSDPADVLIINTCAFIEDAVKESLGAISREARKKRKGDFEHLVVAGCLPQRYGRSLMNAVPAIDGMVGTFEYDMIVQVVDDVVRFGRRPCALNIKDDGTVEGVYPRVISTPPWTAYLKIAEGCDNRCSYCMIPRLRGPLKSRPREDICNEARRLAGMGVKEVILVAQDVTAYGRDSYGSTKPSPLVSLLGDLQQIDGIEWIRLLYAHPAHIDEYLVKAISEMPKVAKYLDLPVQHAGDAVLRLMGRPGSAEQYLHAVQALRRRVGGITLRSTFMIGFPGEDRRSFAELLRFMIHARFDYAGFFLYSPERPTSAFALPGKTRNRVAKRRLKRAAALQQLISYSQNRRYPGTVLKVLMEGKVPQSPQNAGPPSLSKSGVARLSADDLRSVESRQTLWFGRHEGQAPEVDGVVLVRVPADVKVKPGRFASVRITAATAYDLSGHLVECL